ncbi:hypothetical protein IVB30_02070 [Bradyrhizobium sp. 200]|uniref:hypothetical protein n=1 Tax=Bradyrhizobium sp. 200 TaxID=2782665 RepID=UPI0020002FDC|nr:hypothetical protein [Bradyrhizobium sp. 200]UPJ50244.1 hypothetical protein IVB30_02070 [Bradyrhizobium sp. 200]
MLAMSFGSTDGTIEGVANRFDRARLQARIRFEEREAENRRREILFDSGSPDGSFERLPAAKREAALLKARRAHADMHAASRDAMRHPALLRSRMATFLNPFAEED